MDDRRKKEEEWRRAMDELFGSTDMNEVFEAMREQMDRMMKAIASGELDISQLTPYVSGLSMRVGPDGQPHIERFGHTGQQSRMTPTKEEDAAYSREPLTDIIVTDRQLCITVEVPGIEKKDINLEVVDETLVISVDTDARRYFKEIKLPCPVDETSAKATYNNGVLDITLQKVPREKKGTKITVE